MINRYENIAPLALRVDEFRQRMGGISRSHFYQLVSRNEIRVVKLGHRTLVPTSEAERLLAGGGRK
jgi:excisionase family DNA binding protein